MRQKIYEFLNKLYGIIMTVSFFAGIIPLIPFVIAIIIGGPVAETISVFLYKSFYPCVIAGASIAVIIGTVAMYVGKKDGLTPKKTKK